MPAKVVITGLGTVNPLGINVQDTWAKLLAGRSGIGRIRAFDPEEWGLKTHIAGEVTDIDPAEHIGRKEARRLDRFSQFALLAAQEAWEQAGMDLEDEEARYNVGTLVASGVGGVTTLVDQAHTLRDQGARRVNPFTVPMLMPNAASGLVSMKLGAWGPSFAGVSACSSAADAVGIAMDMIRAGRVKAMIAGGSEAAILPICVAGFEQARALCSSANETPETASRPFDKNRDGFVLSEGAGIIVLEDEAYARNRGATIIGELAGYGAASDGYHITAPEPEGRGATRAMTGALDNAELNREEIDYINAHGTSTPLNDKVESLVVQRMFTNTVPMSSTKSMTGHLGGAAGGLEAVICAKVVETGWMPPTINYDTPDPECDIDVVPWEPRRTGGGAVLSNSFGFGGHCSCLAFRSYGG
jgi:beta-ketoacyl-acyl-carrier-protein synthase II